MASEPLGIRQRIHLGEGVEFDPTSDELYRGGRVFKLERIPATVLLFLIEKNGEVVRREEIVERVWGKNAFLDTDNGINSAIRKIRQALKDDPESPRFIQTITGRGYRYIGPVNDPPIEDNDAPARATSSQAAVMASKEATTVSAEPHQRRQLLTRGNLLLALGTIGILLTALLVVNHNHGKENIQPTIKSLVVLPLKNLSGDASQEYLADGMTEALIGSLSGIRDLRVLSRTSSMHFKNTQLSVPEIAKILRVDAIVEGSLIREGDRIRIHAQLIRAATDEHFWSETYDRELKDVLSLQSDVAQSIADKVEVTITGPERQKLASVPSVPPEVYENYLRGLFALRKSNSRAEIEKSITYFRKATEKDPSFAPAYLGISDAYFRESTIFIGVRPEEVHPKEMAAAQRALELDPQSVEAHLSMATMHRVQWQWVESQDEFRRALELNPNNAAAYKGLANWLAIQGRTDEAVAWIRRGRELDPIEVSATDVSWILFLSHRFPEAVQESQSAVTLQPDDPVALWYLGYALIANSQPEEAIPPMEKALALSDRSPGIIGVLIRAYAHAGRRADALHLLAELMRRRNSGYVPPAAFVNAYLGVGDNDRAMGALEEGYKEHSNILQFLKVHPHFDPLRNDPRFRDLVRRVGLD